MELPVFLQNHLSLWIVIPIIFCVSFLSLTLAKRILFRAIKRLASKTTTQIDDIIIASANLPLTFLALVLSAGMVQPFFPFDEDSKMLMYYNLGFKGALILTMIIFADQLCDGFVRFYATRIEILRSSAILVRGGARLAIAGIGFLIILDSFGVSITPIIASLGLGSLAIALAVKSTLENFVCGMQLVADQPIMVGHFVKVESGEEGYVEKIGWRSTWIKLPTNNIVIIPNSSLVNSKITNFHYPTKAIIVKVEVGVHYNSDLERVEKIAKEVANEVMKKVPAGVPSFESKVIYHTFDASSINFTVVMEADQFDQGGLIKHEFIKRLHKRFNQEGIVMPYPIRAINYEQEKAFERKEENVRFK